MTKALRRWWKLWREIKHWQVSACAAIKSGMWDRRHSCTLSSMSMEHNGPLQMEDYGYTSPLLLKSIDFVLTSNRGRSSWLKHLRQPLKEGKTPWALQAAQRSCISRWKPELTSSSDRRDIPGPNHTSRTCSPSLIVSSGAFVEKKHL
jgi:hypothetical protein